MATKKRKTSSGEKKNRHAVTLPVQEDPGKRYYQNRLTWLLKFLNTDIKDLPVGGFLKIFHEFMEFLYLDAVENADVFREYCVDTAIDRDRLSRAQGYTKMFVKMIFGELDEKLMELFPKKLSVSYEICPDEFRSVSVRRVLILQDHDLYHDKIVWMTPAEIESIDFGEFSKFKDKKIRDNIRYSVSMLLMKFKAGSIGVCPDCGMFYKKTARKKSPLCSRCLKHSTTNQWRDDNREVYNAYQRNLQKGIKEPIKDIRKEMEQAKGKEEG